MIGAMRLTNLDFVVILAYLAGLFLIGIVASRRQSSEEVYFLSGRRTPWLLAGVSVLATLLSTLTFMSLPGEMIRYGVGLFSSVLAFFLVIPTVNRIIIPYLMRLPVTSVYDYLERRFGLEARMLGAAVFVVMRLVWIGMIIYTASLAVHEMTGWPVWAIVLVVGVVTTFYTTTGGLQAVIWSDFAQFLLLFGGAVFVPVYVAIQTGSNPVDWWQTFEASGRGTVPVMSLDLTVRITMLGIIIDFFVWNVCTHSADQVAAQRYLSTPSAAAARRSVWVFSVCNIGVILMLMMCGLALYFFYYHDTLLSPEGLEAEIARSADTLLPRFIAEQLPAGVTGLILSALLAAAMSSMSSGINSISTVVFTDFYRRFRAADEMAPANLLLPKLLAALAGAFGICMALAVYYLMQHVDWNLVEMIQRVNHLFLAPLGGMFLAGILFRRVGLAAALCGFFLGVVMSFLISFNQYGISFMWILPGAFAATMGSSYLLGFVLVRKKYDEELD